METVINPMVEYASLAAVQEAAGFSLLVPRGISAHLERVFLISNRVIDLKLSNGMGYRMAKGKDDISGSWTEYPEEKIALVGKYAVTEKGIFGKVLMASWTDGEYAFALNSPYGIDREGLHEIIGSLEPVGDAICNPVVKYEYVFQAEYAVGFGIPVPAMHNADTLKGVYVISGKVAELEYVNGIVYRVARGVEDISGVYQRYERSDGFSVGDYRVLAKGRADCYYVTLWNDGRMSFSLYCPQGISRKEAEEFIRSLSQIN